MELIDLIVVLVVGAGLVSGFLKGGIKQFASIAGLIIGLYAAKLMYESLAEKLCPTVTASMTFAQIISFVMIWVAVPLAFAIIAALFTRTLQAISLGWLNRLVGALLGALKNLLLISLFINVIQFVDSDNQLIPETKKKSSLLYYRTEKVAGILFPLVKEVTKHYIN